MAFLSCSFASPALQHNEQARLVQIRVLIDHVENSPQVVGLLWNKNERHPRGCRRLWWHTPTPPLRLFLLLFFQPKILPTIFHIPLTWRVTPDRTLKRTDARVGNIERMMEEITSSVRTWCDSNLHVVRRGIVASTKRSPTLLLV